MSLPQPFASIHRGRRIDRSPGKGRRMRREYDIHDGILQVNKEMDFDYDIGFDRACNMLVASPERNLLIDLTRVKHITSSCVGLMAAAFFQARELRKTIAIVARGDVLKTLRLAGFGQFMALTD